MLLPHFACYSLPTVAVTRHFMSQYAVDYLARPQGCWSKSIMKGGQHCQEKSI